MDSLSNENIIVDISNGKSVELNNEFLVLMNNGRTELQAKINNVKVIKFNDASLLEQGSLEIEINGLNNTISIPFSLTEQEIFNKIFNRLIEGKEFVANRFNGNSIENYKHCEKCSKEHRNNDNLCDNCKQVFSATKGNVAWYKSTWFFWIMVVLMPYIAVVIMFVQGHYKSKKILRALITCYAISVVGTILLSGLKSTSKVTVNDESSVIDVSLEKTPEPTSTPEHEKSPAPILTPTPVMSPEPGMRLMSDEEIFVDELEFIKDPLNNKDDFLLLLSALGQGISKEGQLDYTTYSLIQENQDISHTGLVMVQFIKEFEEIPVELESSFGLFWNDNSAKEYPDVYKYLQMGFDLKKNLVENKWILDFKQEGVDINQENTNNNLETESSTVVDYIKLYNDYDNNPIAADDIYKGKTLKITGKISSIDRELLGGAYITFAVDEYGFKNVQMVFNKSEEDKITNLSKGQQVTVIGECRGQTLGTVLLSKCYFAE